MPRVFGVSTRDSPRALIAGNAAAALRRRDEVLQRETSAVPGPAQHLNNKPHPMIRHPAIPRPACWVRCFSVGENTVLAL
jgi:hypothetical protein